MCDVDKLTSQLLELSKQMANSSKSFHIFVKTEKLNFTCSIMDRGIPPNTAKRIMKKYPSQKNRDFLRRRTFLEKKLNQIESKADIFECNQCDFKNSSEIELNVHIEKQHNIQAQKVE